VSVTTLYEAFRRAAATGEISAGEDPLIAAILADVGETQLPLANGQAVRASSTATLTGQTSWRNADWSLTLTASSPQGVDRLDLALELVQATPWTLGQAFPDLPPSRTSSASDGGTLPLVPSVLAPLVVEQPHVLARADYGAADAYACRLQGWLPLTGALEPYAGYLGSTRLWLDGDISFGEPASPVLNLIAWAPNADISIPNLPATQAGLRLDSAYPDLDALTESPLFNSMIELVYQVDLGGRSSTVADLSAPLLQAGLVFPASGSFDPPLTLVDGIASLVSIIEGSKPGDFQLPAGLAPLDAFGVSTLQFGVTQSNTVIPLKLVYSEIGVVSTTAWNVPVPFVTIDEVGVSWLLNWSSSSPLLTGSIWGTMAFGAKGPKGPQPPVTGVDGEPILLEIVAQLPSLDIEARTVTPILLPLSDAFAAFFGGPKPSVPLDLVIEELSLSASIATQTYGATLKVATEWTIGIGDVGFTLANIQFEMSVSQSTVSGSLAGFLGVSVGSEQKALFTATAAYPGDGPWVFTAGLTSGKLDLTEFALAFLGYEPPQWLPSLELTRLWAGYSTAPGNPYGAGGTLALRWEPEILGLTLSLIADAEIRYYQVASAPAAVSRAALFRQGDSRAIVDPPAGPLMTYAGSVTGVFELNRLAIAVGLSFVGKEQTYLFGVRIEDFNLEARTSWIGVAPKRHQVLTVQMAGSTLGGLVESFARLANPNLNYRLEAPWTFLNSIDLGRFTLILDPTEQAVTLDYKVNLNLAFINITSVGLRYDRASGEPEVTIELTGTFLGKTYDRSGAPGTKPLAWNALNDAPPSVPGGGLQLIDLRYLGLGQHVDLQGLTRPDSMAEIIKLLQQQMQPIADPKLNPLNQPSGSAMRFNEASQWLIGLDVTLMGTVSVGLVMHDPDLYGILIGLRGPSAGTLSGFSFELIYKKVTNDIGVFHVRLQVPDVFRQLEFGVVQITLGIITVDVFTNGNFMIDLGFPHQRDFSLSFGIVYGVFIGRGGIYFGLLNGATSKRVPSITNGQFSPVLELGVGLAVGVGRTFNKGPLRAGMYVQVEVIFQGVLAWFHPDDAGKPDKMYYWAQGTAALVGRVYGAVDFKVISINVDFEAYAAATLSLAVYQPTLIELKVGVRVVGQVKIVFFKFKYSFETSVEASFTVGQASPTPWILGPDQGGRTLTGKQAGVKARRRRPYDMRAMAHQARLTKRAGGGRRGLAQARARLEAADPCAGYDLIWDPSRRLFPDGAIKPVPVTLVPGMTVAEAPVAWSGTTPPANPDPQWRLIFMLSVESATPPQAATIAETHRQTAEASAQAAGVADIGFNVLVEAMLRWAVSALPDVEGPVTAGDLADLAGQLDCPQTLDQGFSFETLSTLFAGNLLLQMTAAPQAGADRSAVVFPMPPNLNWTSPDLPVEAERTRDFASFRPVDAVYQAGVAAYFHNLDPRERAHRSAPLAMRAEEAGQSMASFVFRDYMALLAKSAVEACDALLQDWPWDLTATDTLAGIATTFPRIELPYTVSYGDTVDQVAAALGASASEILALNPGLPGLLAATPPGETILVTLGVTPESLAAGNPDWPLAAGKTIPLQAAVTQVLEGESLQGVASRMHANAQAWIATDALLDVEGLTRPGAPLAVSGLTYANPLALDLRTVAAVFYARQPGGTDFPMADWYGQAIAELNPDTIGADGGLPSPVRIPAAYDQLADPLDWTPLPGDSRESIARAAALAQNPVAGSGFELFMAEVQALNPNHAGGAVALPAGSWPILPDETLRELATRLLLVDPAAQPFVPTAAFAPLVLNADILRPLAQVLVTNASLPTAPGQTLASFASLYDLAIEAVGRLGQDVAGLLALQAGKPLSIAAVPAASLDALIARIQSGAQAATIAGQVTRFLLNGQRVPAPVAVDGHYEATGPMTGLYELVGQQVVGPAPDSAQPPETVRAQITLQPDAPTPWLGFVASQAVTEADTAESLATAWPRFAELNPAGRLAPGMVVLTEAVDSLTLQVTQAQLALGYPATGLLPQLEGGLTAMTLYRDDPVRHPMGQVRRWQTPVAPSWPAFSGEAARSGMPSLWPIGGDLAAAALKLPTTAFDLKLTDPALGPEAPPRPVANSVWATLVELRIQKIPGQANTYDLIGADTAGRQHLLELWRYLDNNSAETADIQVLYQLSESAGLPSGLTSAPLNPDLSYLVKTNLSTETRSGAQARADGAEPTFGDFYARITDSGRFLTLVWEASVVGGGGYWLEITGTDGAGLPENIFAAEGGAVINLLVVLGSQSSASPSRRILPFNSCALVADPLDPSASALFAEAAGGAETVRQATVSPGQVGFTLNLSEPPMTGVTGPEEALRELYGLVGYQMAETAAFAASNEGKPVAPTSTDGETTWRLSRVLPAGNFAKSHPLPVVAGLPAPADDPYAGISSPGQSAISTARVAVWFHDVYGNSSAAPAAPEKARRRRVF
jgi:hypothetical protein